MNEVVVFVSEIMGTVAGWKGMPIQFVAAGVIALLVSSLKVSMVRSVLWDRLGSAKVFAAPMLSLIGSLVAVKPFTWATIWMALSTGAGAIAMYEIAMALRALPGLAPLYAKVLDLAVSFFSKRK